MVSYHICNSESLWSKYMLFYLQHRHEINVNCSVQSLIQDIIRYMDHGHAIVAMNSKGEVVAITSCYIGTTAEHFENKHIAILHNSYILPSYQTSRIFLRGLKLNVEEIAKASPKVEKMLIYTPVSSSYLNNLYSKIARKTDPPHEGWPAYNQYVISIEALSRYGTNSQHKNDE